MLSVENIVFVSRWLLYLGHVLNFSLVLLSDDEEENY